MLNASLFRLSRRLILVAAVATLSACTADVPSSPPSNVAALYPSVGVPPGGAKRAGPVESGLERADGTQQRTRAVDSRTLRPAAEPSASTR